jgi:hypothetical protein
MIGAVFHFRTLCGGVIIGLCSSDSRLKHYFVGLQVQKFQKQISKSINANIEAELMLKAQKAHEGKPFHTLGKVPM